MQHQLLGNIDTGIWGANPLSDAVTDPFRIPWASLALNPLLCTGFYYEGLQPALIVQSGDTIDWELPTMTAHYACMPLFVTLLHWLACHPGYDWSQSLILLHMPTIERG